MKFFLSIVLLLLLFNVNSQSYVWSESFGCQIKEDVGHTIAVDTLGNVYSAGRFQDSMANYVGNDTIWSLSNGGVDFFLSKHDENGNLKWVKTFGGNGWDLGSKLVIDKFQNIYAVGYFADTLNLFVNGINETYITQNQGTNTDFFICKFDSLGNIIWFNHYGNVSNEGITSLAIDSENNLYFAGSFSDSLDLDPSINQYNLYAANDGLFVSKINDLGQFIWANKISGNSDLRVVNIVSDLLGNIVLTGNFSGTIDFNSSGNVNNLTPGNVENSFLLKLNNLGEYQWAKAIKSNGNVYASNLNIDKSNNIIVSGSFINSTRLIYDSDTLNFVSDDLSDIFLIKIDENGNFNWGKQVKGTGFERTSSIQTDSNNNIYYSGILNNTILDLNPDTLIEQIIQCGTTGSIISKLDSNGIFLGAKKVYAFHACYLEDIFLNNDMTLYGIGSFAGYLKADLDNPTVYTDSSETSYDVFIVKWNLNNIVFDNNLSVNKIEDNLFIFQNLDNNSVQIKVNKPTELVICNSLNQVVKSFMVNNEYYLDLTCFSNGIYFISDLKYSSTKKIIKL